MRNLLILLTYFIVLPLFSQVKKLPHGFIENKGQLVDQNGHANNKVKYLLNTNGLNVQLRENGFSYDVYEIKKKSLPSNHFQNASNTTSNDIKKPNLVFKYHRIDINFKNSNNEVKLIAEEPLADYDNYYNVPNAPDGITNVHQFQKVTYKNIYNNIDVAFSIPKDTTKPVEYNFIIHPGGKMTDIQLQFDGAKTRLVDNKIKMNVRFGPMEETIPLSWCDNGNVRTTFAIHYKKISNHIYGFEDLEYPTNKTIIIDPVPVRLWASYFYGYAVSEDAVQARPDNAGNLLLSGIVNTNMNIATSGAFITTVNSSQENSFLTKFGAVGQRLWTTYISNGLNYAYVKDFVINSANESYLVGETAGGQGVNQSNALATPGTHKTYCDFFYSEAFIVKLDSNGMRLWGSFFGGNNGDTIDTIGLDSAENIIFAGRTRSDDQITTPGSFQVSDPNVLSAFNESGFFCKFDSTGHQLYGSFFFKGIEHLAIDNNNNVYFAGRCNNSAGDIVLATVNAHQTTCNWFDIFFTKFDSNFNQQWCTFYGGIETANGYDNSDRCSEIVTDNNNDVYLIGTTSSTTNIATPGSYKDTLLPGITNSFIAKFDGAGTRLWGTYYGSQISITRDSCESGSINKATGDLYITGNTRDINYYANPTAFQPTNRGSDECFIAKINASGFPVWSTYYGTPSQDYSYSISYKNNAIYCSGFSTGVATAGNNLGTPGSFMPTGGGWYNFVAKFSDCVSAPQIAVNTPICTGSTIQLSGSGATTYSWTGPNGFTSTLASPSIPNATVANSGQYTCNITGTGGCDGTYRVTVAVGDTINPIPNLTALPTITGDCTTIVSTIPTATDNCSGNIVGTTTDPLSYASAGTYTILWKYDDGNGNVATQNQTVIINAVALPAATSPQPFCIQQNATLISIAITGQNIQWYDAPINGNLLAANTLLVDGTTYYASQTINTCESTRIPVIANIVDTPAPTGSILQTFCATQNPTLNDIVITGNTITWYSNSIGNTPLPSNTILTNGATFYASQNANGCESVARFMVTVQLTNTLNATDYQETICDDLNDASESVNLTSYNAFLIANATTTTFEYYYSLLGAINLASDQLIVSTGNYSLNIGLNTIYVRITSSAGCFQIVKLDLTLVPKPQLNMPDTVALCESTIIAIDAGFGFDSYLWSTGSTAQSILVSTTGNYSVTVTKQNGSVQCATTKNFEVVLSSAATITSITTQDLTEDENTIVVNVSGNGIYEFSLDGINYQSSPIFSGLRSGIYTIYVRDINGCGIVEEDFYLLMYSKFFTPNGDGYNDRWSIDFSYLEPGLQIEIFDRYGKLLKSLDYKSSWDGKFNEIDVPSDDYWFIVTRANGKIFKGHFALKR